MPTSLPLSSATIVDLLLQLTATANETRDQLQGIREDIQEIKEIHQRDFRYLAQRLANLQGSGLAAERGTLVDGGSGSEVDERRGREDTVESGLSQLLSEGDDRDTEQLAPLDIELENDHDDGGVVDAARKWLQTAPAVSAGAQDIDIAEEDGSGGSGTYEEAREELELPLDVIDSEGVQRDNRVRREKEHDAPRWVSAGFPSI